MARKPLVRWLFVTALALAVGALLAFLFWPRPLKVDTALVRTGPIAETVADQGLPARGRAMWCRRRSAGAWSGCPSKSATR